MQKSISRNFVFIALSVLILLTLPGLACNPDNASSELNLVQLEPVTLDPAISSESTSHLYISQLFSGLVKLDQDLYIVPDIAEKWTISDDGTIYTFTLKEGVKFHNGKEVTAEDFKYSWERACNPMTGSDTAATYLNDIIGADDVLYGLATEIEGVEVLDKYTLKVTIDEPKKYFLSKLTYQTSFVTDKENVESNIDWWRNPNGTGPFKLKEWVPGERITMVANDNYYGDPVKLEKINFDILAGYPLSLYETDMIDIAPISEFYIDAAEDPQGRFYQDLQKYPAMGFQYIGFNTTKPPFDDINVRQAFCHAVNKEKIIEVILKDTVINSEGIIPPGIPGYNPEFQTLDYDIEKAKELIANSKYGDAANLPPIIFTTAGFGGAIPKELGAIVQGWEEDLGVDITVRQLEPDIFNYNLDSEVDNIYMYGWIADYPDPQDFLDILFYTGSNYNVGKYSNKEVDNLLDRAGIEADETKRFELYREAEQMILLDAPSLPLWSDINYVLIKPYVKDYELNAMGMPSLDKTYIEDRLQN